MGRYDDENYGVTNPNGRQRDLVLSINEFCFLQNKTDGSIKSHVGPTMTTISQQESLVVFNTRSKKFEETTDFTKAKQLFTSAPEGWYVILKNPTSDSKHPEAGKPNVTPKDIKIGTKVNIPGPVSFALYPGQMAKVVPGHKLRSNQYLIARVYDADAAQQGMNSATIVDAEGKEVENKTEKYFVGQLLVIKGTEVSFYMPPTGIEVIPQTPYGNDYIRDAITLERLEYAILKDEDGEKRYVHGPAVVFPKPTETFVNAPKGGAIFRALELSPISGIYVKVIAAYKDEDGTEHPIGEELFITGKDQMIYYPRPEHAMIQYDGKYMHHAIAIPEGEGRYLLNRLTGDIRTIKGPMMYLPDPRTEVVVKRKLTTKECQLIYPGNREVIEFNEQITEKAMEKLARKGVANSLDAVYATSNQEASLAIFEANANISRGVSYTKPRTITLDTKYDGVVTVDVWTGYAINVVSKKGNREVVVGPATRLLNYDETLEAIQLSTGSPKTENVLITDGYLKIENNKVSDCITAQTKDFVTVQIKLAYTVNFLSDYKDKWFAVNNYVKYLCDYERSALKRMIKEYTIEEFYSKAAELIRNCVLDINPEAEAKDSKYTGKVFEKNGMNVVDVEVVNVAMDRAVADIMERSQADAIRRNLALSEATEKMEIEKKLAEYAKTEATLKHQNEMYKLELQKKSELERLAVQTSIKAKERAEIEAAKQAEADLQKVIDLVEAAKLARDKKHDEARIETEKALAAIEKDKQDAYAETVAKIMESVTPDLIAALSTKANADLLTQATKSMSPYAIANGESVAETVDKLMRGTTLEGILTKVAESK